MGKDIGMYHPKKGNGAKKMLPDAKLQKYLETVFHPENVHFVGYQCGMKIAVYQIKVCESVWETKYFVKK